MGEAELLLPMCVCDTGFLQAFNLTKAANSASVEDESPHLEKEGNKSCAMSGSAEEDFFHMLKEPETPQEEKTTGLDKFFLRETEFKDQLRLWRMDVSKENPKNKDLLVYLKSIKQKSIDRVKEDVEKYGAIKTTFGTLVNFQRERNGVIQKKRQWFHEKEPHLFSKANLHEAGEKYDKYVEWIMGQVSAWNSKA